MKSVNKKDIVKKYYEELWNKQNMDYIDLILDDNIKFHGSLNIETLGKKPFKEYMKIVLGGIPNLYHGIEIMIEENETIAVKAIYNGTHSGKLLEFPATNNRIKYNGASFFKFKGDKISDIWVLGDLTTLKRQLSNEK